MNMKNIAFYIFTLCLPVIVNNAQAKPASPVVTGSAEVMFLEPTKTSVNVTTVQSVKSDLSHRESVASINASIVDGTVAWRGSPGLQQSEGRHYILPGKMNSKNILSLTAVSDTKPSVKYPGWFVGKNKQSSLDVSFNPAQREKHIDRYTLSIDTALWAD